MNAELVKIEDLFEKLRVEKADVESKFPSIKDTELAFKFSKLVGDKFSRCKQVRLTYLQAEVTIGGATNRLRDTADTTKKEIVMLAKFGGDKETAYMKYPVWRKRWVSHIIYYEEKYLAKMLLNHLDSQALEKIIGHVNEYDRAMAALDQCYNNCYKIVAACLKEIKALPNVMAGDYKA